MGTQTVAVVGLGYVGLPLAIGFGRKLPTIGFDIAQRRVEFLKRHEDPTNEVNKEDFQSAKQLTFTCDPAALKQADFVVVAVPTPVDEAKRPDFKPLEGASKTLGQNLKRGAVVVYESTVYPGATEEICVPILERESGLKCGKDFFVGYSPERINPGDKEHTLERIVKVVAGQDAATTDRVAWLYEQVVTAGVYRASSIKVAEAAKVIENTQRDLNIALMNELAMIFHKMGIDTLEVLEAAGTKWNFLPFRPGLVGGHCIGVDPYYLTHKSEMLGYSPHVILAGRRVNDSVGAYIAGEAVKTLLSSGVDMRNAKVTVMGITFKENCPDVRNSKVIDIITELKSFGVGVQVWDPVADAKEVEHEYGVRLESWEDLGPAHAIVAAVAHKEVLSLSAGQLKSKIQPKGLFVDVKAKFSRTELEGAGLKVWRL